MSKEAKTKAEDRGCLTAFAIILGSIVGAGVIYFVGRTFFGEDGSFIFFYTLLGVSVTAILLKAFWDRRKRGR
jgi:hypothetical protein